MIIYRLKDLRKKIGNTVIDGSNLFWYSLETKSIAETVNVYFGATLNFYKIILSLKQYFHYKNTMPQRNNGKKKVTNDSEISKVRWFENPKKILKFLKVFFKYINRYIGTYLYIYILDC